MEACRNPLLNDLPESRNENHHLPNPNPNAGPISGSGPTTSGKRSKSKWQDGKSGLDSKQFFPFFVSYWHWSPRLIWFLTARSLLAQDDPRASTLRRAEARRARGPTPSSRRRCSTCGTRR